MVPPQRKTSAVPNSGTPRAKRTSSAPKLRRWVDLLAALLRRKYAVTLEQLKQDVPGYAAIARKAALRRMFERDKDELRAFGVPIETAALDDGGESGYRLDKHAFYLPYLVLVAGARRSRPRRVDRYGYRALAELAFEPDELAAVVAAATRVGQLGDPELTAHAESALRKLAVDLPVDATRGDTERLVRSPAVVDEEVFATLGSALERRKSVTVTYQSMNSGAGGERKVYPYGLFFLGQHWYLAAAAPGDRPVKNYRLSRIREVRVNASRPGTSDYEIPAAFRLREHARSRHAWELGNGDAEEAIVAFRGAGGAARAAARLGAPVPGMPDGRQFLVRRRDSFVRWLLSLAGDAMPVSPPDLVEDYRRLLLRTLKLYDS